MAGSANNTLVYQACTRPIPDEIKHCLERAELYSIDNGFEYKLDDLDRGKFKYLSSASDRQRVQLLAERPYTLWVDWDLLLLDDFQLPKERDLPMRAGDYLIWNGADTKTFAEALTIFDAYNEEYEETAYQEHYRMWKSLRAAGYLKIPQFNRATYKHFKWSGTHGETVSNQIE